MHGEHIKVRLPVPCARRPCVPHVLWHPMERHQRRPVERHRGREENCSLLEQHSQSTCKHRVSFGCDPVKQTMWVTKCRGRFRCAGDGGSILCGYPPGQHFYECSCSVSDRLQTQTLGQSHGQSAHTLTLSHGRRSFAARTPMPPAVDALVARPLLHTLSRPQQRFPSEASQDKCLVKEVFGRKVGGYYIDLASNDAVKASNTYALDRLYKWSGVCIEPQPTYLNGLMSHRTCAIAPLLIGTGSMVAFKESASPVYSRVVQRPELDVPNNETTMKRTVPLRDVLKAVHAPRDIHYMSLDVEGFEYAVMQQFPFDEHRIHVMTVERPTPVLHRLLLSHNMCVLGNLAPFVDIMYANRSLLHNHQDVNLTRCARFSALDRALSPFWRGYIRPSHECSFRHV